MRNYPQKLTQMITSSFEFICYCCNVFLEYIFIVDIKNISVRFACNP